jgi:hypothetical protein
MLGSQLLLTFCLSDGVVDSRFDLPQSEYAERSRAFCDKDELVGSIHSLTLDFGVFRTKTTQSFNYQVTYIYMFKKSILYEAERSSVFVCS